MDLILNIKNENYGCTKINQTFSTDSTILESIKKIAYKQKDEGKEIIKITGTPVIDNKRICV
jgi:hypothetical protein